MGMRLRLSKKSATRKLLTLVFAGASGSLAFFFLFFFYGRFSTQAPTSGSIMRRIWHILGLVIARTNDDLGSQINRDFIGPVYR